MTPDMTMAKDNRTTEKDFNIPKQEAIKLVGKSEKTLQRWVNEGLIQVEYRDGPYGKEAYYNRDDLLKMRRGKPRQKADDAPLAKADLAVIARGAEWNNQQLARAIETISRQLPVIQEQLKELVKAKDETIKAKEEQGELKEKLGFLKATEAQLKSELEKIRQERKQVEGSFRQQMDKIKRQFRHQIAMVSGWVIFLIVALVLLGVFFAPQLDQFRRILFSL